MQTTSSLTQPHQSLAIPTSGGTAVTLTDNYELTVDATDAAIVDIVNNKFVIANTFTSGDKVTYNVNGGTAIAGLTDGTEYFVINASPTQFALSDIAGGTAIDLTAVGTELLTSTCHIGSTHNVRKISVIAIISSVIFRRVTHLRVVTRLRRLFQQPTCR